MRIVRRAKFFYPHSISVNGVELFFCSDKINIYSADITLFAKNNYIYDLYRYTKVIKCGGDSLFVKSTKLIGFRLRLRCTLGVMRSKGLYDWPIEELVNNINAYKAGAPVPEVKGFGVRRNGFMLNELILFVENLDGYVDGFKWIKSPECNVIEFVMSAVNLIVDLHDCQVYHLDLWVGNIMLDPQRPGRLKAIDLENAFVGEVESVDRVLGFQFGFFYHRVVRDVLEEFVYDELVFEFIKSKSLVLDKAIFNEVYYRSKVNHIGRKSRRDFIAGC